MNIYTKDRKAAVDSFQCYWQIDYMFRKLEFGMFPLVEDAEVRVVQSDKSHRHGSSENGGH